MYKAVIAAIGLTLSISPAIADGYAAPPTVEYRPVQAAICNPMTVQVYFQNGETMLSSSARRTIETAGNSLSGCALSSIKITSIAHDGRTKDEASALALSRIETVQSALTDEGLTWADTSTVIEPNVAADPHHRILARRVEVTLAAYRPEIG